MKGISTRTGEKNNYMSKENYRNFSKGGLRPLENFAMQESDHGICRAVDHAFS